MYVSKDVLHLEVCCMSAAWRLRNALIDVIGWLSRAPCTNLNLFLLTKEFVYIYIEPNDGRKCK